MLYFCVVFLCCIFVSDFLLYFCVVFLGYIFVLYFSCCIFVLYVCLVSSCDKFVLYFCVVFSVLYKYRLDVSIACWPNTIANTGFSKRFNMILIHS